jgi:hypothetical protein
MNKKERIKKIKNLSDIKRIRYNTGTLVYSMLIIGMFIFMMNMMGFAVLFLSLNFIYLGIFFGIFEIIGLFLMFTSMYMQSIKEEEFLNEN